jgi:hypothetical protein
MNKLVATLATTAVLAGTASTLAPAYADTAARSGASVTIKVNHTAPETGDTIKVKGTVKKAGARRQANLQVKYADQKKWKTIAHTKVFASGAYKFKDKVTTVRERTYRVVLPATRTQAAVTSAKEKVTVYGWRALTSLNPAGPNNGLYEAGKVTMNGVDYPYGVTQELYSTTNGTIDYNLNRHCTRLEGQVGASDMSANGGSVALGIATEAGSKYAGSFGLAQSAPVAVDVTKAFRVTLSSVSTAGGLGGFGDLQVLCSF